MIKKLTINYLTNKNVTEGYSVNISKFYVGYISMLYLYKLRLYKYYYSIHMKYKTYITNLYT